MIRLFAVALALLACSGMAIATPASATRSGGEIMQRFHAGLAQGACDDASNRWRVHYAHSTKRLAEDAAAMAYNAGEGALKASRGKQARVLSGITRSYPRKLHAIACLFDAGRADRRWQRAIERQVPRLAARRLPAGTQDVRRWARQQGLDPALVAALNPAWHSGHGDVLAPMSGPRAAGRDRPGKAH